MSQSPIRLEVHNLHWLGDLGASEDLCAHGAVTFEVGGVPAWKDGSDDLCVSAAAMNLLRTIESDHQQEEDPVTWNLFPHCGHVWASTEEHGLVNICDCPAGRDATVRHNVDRVTVTAPSGKLAEVSRAEWAELICAFADKVEEFTRQAGQKSVHEDDAEWYDLFWKEWGERRARATSV